MVRERGREGGRERDREKGVDIWTSVIIVSQFKGSSPLLGDLLCLIGSFLYAVSNVAQEFLVKNHTVTEYLGLLGVFGSVVSATQL